MLNNNKDVLKIAWAELAVKNILDGEMLHQIRNVIYPRIEKESILKRSSK